jgi:FSR family fosmidomycin resistance protein-like MFS transporter
MTTTASIDLDKAAEEAVTKHRERRALGVACSAHVLHDGYTDLIWVALPIWQTEFGLSYAAVGLLRMIYSGTMASLQIPASHIAERAGGGSVLAIGTGFCGLCYCLAGIGSGFWALGGSAVSRRPWRGDAASDWLGPRHARLYRSARTHGFRHL